MTRMTGPDCVVMCNLINTHTHTDQCEWHRIIRMAGPDCAVTCNLIHTYTHTHTHLYCTLLLHNRHASRTKYKAKCTLNSNNLGSSYIILGLGLIRRLFDSEDSTLIFEDFPL